MILECINLILEHHINLKFKLININFNTIYTYNHIILYYTLLIQL